MFIRPIIRLHGISLLLLLDPFLFVRRISSKKWSMVKPTDRMGIVSNDVLTVNILILLLQQNWIILFVRFVRGNRKMGKFFFFPVSAPVRQFRSMGTE